MSDTSLVAIRTDSNERITIADVPLETLRRLSDAHLLCCPQCHSLLTLKAGSVRVHHFAHVSLDDCSARDHEPESNSHRQGKLALYRAFRPRAVLATLEQHLPETDQRADLLIQMPDNRRYALEFQQANNSTQRWLERHRLYQSINVYDVWFLGQVRYQERHTEPLHPISPYDPLPVPRDRFNAMSGSFHARELEKAILSVQPMLYYLDPDSSLLTVLLGRDLRDNTLRAYRYVLPLADCDLRDGKFWTPLEPFITPSLFNRGRSL